MTFNLLLARLFNLVSLTILAAGVWLTIDYVERARTIRALFPDGSHHAPLELLGWGLGLLAWSFLGGVVMRFALGRGGDLHGPYARGEGRLIEAGDGAKLWVESHGEEHAPALILTHGWGLDSTVWREAKRELSRRHRVIVWDLPGLGRSRLAPDGQITLERLADNLGEVLALAGGPAVLVGHSIGGMIIQTYCRQHPEAMGAKVAGVVLENTTATDPVRTTFLSTLLAVIEGPVLRPLMRLEIALSPLMRLMNWQSYLSGWMQLGQRIAGFGTAPCRTLLDHVSLAACRGSPAVQAKGMLAMMDFDKDGENRQGLTAVRVEALVFVGGRDLVTRPAAGMELANLLGAHENRVAFAGHYGPIECPSWYDHALLAFADDAFTRDAVWADRTAADRTAAAAGTRIEGRTWAPPAGARPGLQRM